METITKKKDQLVSIECIKVWPELRDSIVEMGASYDGTTTLQCPVCLNTHVCNAAYQGENNWNERAGCVGDEYLFDLHYYEVGVRRGFDVGPKQGYKNSHELTPMIAVCNLHRYKRLNKVAKTKM